MSTQFQPQVSDSCNQQLITVLVSLLDRPHVKLGRVFETILDGEDIGDVANITITLRLQRYVKWLENCGGDPERMPPCPENWMPSCVQSLKTSAPEQTQICVA